MSSHELPNSKKREYADEFRTLLDWAGGEGLEKMGKILSLALPSVSSVAQGMEQVATAVARARQEGFSPDVGVQVFDFLVSGAEHLKEFGAPVPSWEAKAALQEGRLTWVPLQENY